MISTACLFVLATMALALLRAIRGPSVYDRIVAVNAFGTMTVLLLVLLGFLTDRPEFQDIALLYVLINFVSIIAVLKFVKYNSLAGPSWSADVPEAKRRARKRFAGKQFVGKMFAGKRSTAPKAGGSAATQEEATS